YPLDDWRSLPKQSPPPEPVFWMLRWMLFRLMFGAGMIKLRGDACWSDLTCLQYHFETQPMPNPLSWYLHQLPASVLKGGVLFNHFAELIAPWFAFAPGRWRTGAGLVMIGFQFVLIVSGNLSFLNYLSIVIAISCFDDQWLARLWPAKKNLPQGRMELGKPTARTIPLYALCALVAVLSIRPALNLFSSRQIMNGSFDPIG